VIEQVNDFTLNPKPHAFLDGNRLRDRKIFAEMMHPVKPRMGADGSGHRVGRDLRGTLPIDGDELGINPGPLIASSTSGARNLIEADGVLDTVTPFKTIPPSTILLKVWLPPVN
jgi:hypothetical protein